jgi:hypothetical protein
VLILVGEVLEKYRYWLNNQSILQNKDFWFSCSSHSLNIFIVCALSSNKTCPSVCLIPYTFPLHMGCLATQSVKQNSLPYIFPQYVGCLAARPVRLYFVLPMYRQVSLCIRVTFLKNATPMEIAQIKHKIPI